jgi:hypothetical protein
MTRSSRVLPDPCCSIEAPVVRRNVFSSHTTSFSIACSHSKFGSVRTPQIISPKSLPSRRVDCSHVSAQFMHFGARTKRDGPDDALRNDRSKQFDQSDGSYHRYLSHPKDNKTALFSARRQVPVVTDHIHWNAASIKRCYRLSHNMYTHWQSHNIIRRPKTLVIHEHWRTHTYPWSTDLIQTYNVCRFGGIDLLMSRG